MEARATAASGETDAERAATPDLVPGAVVGGRYRVVGLLGRGGMGAVYEAFEAAIERRVALKLMHPFVAQDARAAARFLEEAKLANRVRHPALVEVTDFGSHAGRPFLVMERLDGESLAARLERDGPLDPAAVVALLEPVCAALAHLHERGIVHRDLKPDNLFLTRVGDAVTPRILDLGVAKARADGQSVTATDAVIGTPLYMAPEQVKSSRSVTPLADQYALGCVAYEMLTRHTPVEADNLHGVLVAKVTADPVDVRAWRPELPAPFADAVMRAVAREPEARFPDVAAFADALRSALTATPAPTTPRQPATPAPAVASAARADPPRRRVWVAPAALLAFAAVSAVAWRALNPSPDVPASPAAARAVQRTPPVPQRPDTAPVVVAPPAPDAAPVAPDAALAAPDAAPRVTPEPAPTRRHRAPHRVRDATTAPAPAAPTISHQMD